MIFSGKVSPPRPFQNLRYNQPAFRFKRSQPSVRLQSGCFLVAMAWVALSCAGLAQTVGAHSRILGRPDDDKRIVLPGEYISTGAC